jgi:hypothetical protein
MYEGIPQSHAIRRMTTMRGRVCFVPDMQISAFKRANIRSGADRRYSLDVSHKTVNLAPCVLDNIEVECWLTSSVFDSER